MIQDFSPRMLRCHRFLLILTNITNDQSGVLMRSRVTVTLRSPPSTYSPKYVEDFYSVQYFQQCVL